MTVLHWIWLIIVAALIGIAYVAAGGRALFGTHERPERVIGALLRFWEPDGLGPAPPALPPARVHEFRDRRYRADFEPAFEFEGHICRSVTFAARHRGYPVSRVKRRDIRAVNAELDSNRRFIASITRV
jgi:hypothetical protein